MSMIVSMGSIAPGGTYVFLGAGSWQENKKKINSKEDRFNIFRSSHYQEKQMSQLNHMMM